MQYSLYIHIPFCRHRCAYCDFNTYAGIENLIPVYVQALCAEIRLLSVTAGRKLTIHTVYFGGGTPSLLSLSNMEVIVKCLTSSFDIAKDSEFSLEANPGTLSETYLRGLFSLGFNRLSIGMQSSHMTELKLLERQHDFSDVIRSVYWARKAGFNNINLDLIFGLPDQSEADWKKSLNDALRLVPEHLSLYSLSLEHGTPMKHWVERGLLSAPDDDLAAEMYEWAREVLGQAGFVQYEISNWARKLADGNYLACRHNLQYWRTSPYLGVGAGAHGYADSMRVANIFSPVGYIQQCLNSGAAEIFISNAEEEVETFPRTPATQTVNIVDQRTAMGEMMMMGLRLVQEGVSTYSFQERFGTQMEDVFGGVIERLIRQGLVEWRNNDGKRLCLTDRGCLLGNRVFLEFL